ncbi:hypothetical protein D9758_001132 [Tetrapyrgos nigripes]|uniref:DUF7719 domain-containing protein n=1 Tax=Tetrapyrgos nigripes TaxID=182062 RepID=A0A8H5GRL3_9AGAR|nr:hypothetical protein D9758_001132 [Tetrapyrgos nigripes]
MARKRNNLEVKKPSEVKPTYQKPLIEISEEEQWRIIQQSGIMHKVSEDDAKRSANQSQTPSELEPVPFAEEVLDAALYIVPVSFLLLLLEILIQNQYGKQPTFQSLIDRMAPGVPVLSVFIFYTKRHKNHWAVQAGLFLISVLVGTRMVWLLARGSWLINMRQVPPLGVLWVYAIVQLNLVLAVVNLLVVFIYVRWKGLQRYF